MVSGGIYKQKVVRKTTTTTSSKTTLKQDREQLVSLLPSHSAGGAKRQRLLLHLKDATEPGLKVQRGRRVFSAFRAADLMSAGCLREFNAALDSVFCGGA